MTTVRKFKPVERTGHLDISEKSGDIRTRREESERGFGIFGLDHGKSGRFEDIGGEEAQKRIIVDDENDWLWIWLQLAHVTTTDPPQLWFAGIDRYGYFQVN